MLFDYDAIHKRVSGSHEMVKKVCKQSIVSMTKTIVAIHTSIKSNDYDKAQRSVHSLKGASVTIGCMQLNTLSIIVEDNLKLKEYNKLPNNFNKLKNVFLITKKHLEKELNIE